MTNSSMAPAAAAYSSFWYPFRPFLTEALALEHRCVQFDTGPLIHEAIPMHELSPPPDITPLDWATTPLAVRTLVHHLLAQVQADQRLLQQQLATLQTRVAELEAQLNQHSGNSSRPPSSDPPSAPPRPQRQRRATSGARNRSILASTATSCRRIRSRTWSCISRPAVHTASRQCPTMCPRLGPSSASRSGRFRRSSPPSPSTSSRPSPAPTAR